MFDTPVKGKHCQSLALDECTGMMTKEYRTRLQDSDGHCGWPAKRERILRKIRALPILQILSLYPWLSPRWRRECVREHTLLDMRRRKILWSLVLATPYY